GGHELILEALHPSHGRDIADHDHLRLFGAPPTLVYRDHGLEDRHVAAATHDLHFFAALARVGERGANGWDVLGRDEFENRDAARAGVVAEHEAPGAIGFQHNAAARDRDAIGGGVRELLKQRLASAYFFERCLQVRRTLGDGLLELGLVREGTADARGG